LHSSFAAADEAGTERGWLMAFACRIVRRPR
jgi:hypothetical protein